MRPLSLEASRRIWVWSAVLSMLALGCTKDKPAAAAGDKPPADAAATTAGKDNDTAPAVPEGRAALAKAWPVLRCALIGAAPQDDKLWSSHGFASADAFATAWQAAAAADPAWARSVVTSAYASPCAAGPAGSPTPTDAPTAAEAAKPEPAAAAPAKAVPAPKVPVAAPAKAP